jgi:GNAT superfamily N-acetyltransferase
MTTAPVDVTFTQITTAREMSAQLREALIGCWMAVSNAGGAVGFPFPPVGVPEVAPVADTLIRGLTPRHSRLIIATVGDDLAGWVHLDRHTNPLVVHWATVRRLQTHPRFRGLGIGATLMRHLQVIARDELGLRQLHLSARGGAGLEDFYRRLGWREIGRWPGALRFGPDDHRDEILMLLDPL